MPNRASPSLQTVINRENAAKATRRISRALRVASRMQPPRDCSANDTLGPSKRAIMSLKLRKANLSLSLSPLFFSRYCGNCTCHCSVLLNADGNAEEIKPSLFPLWRVMSSWLVYNSKYQGWLLQLSVTSLFSNSEIFWLADLWVERTVLLKY